MPGSIKLITGPMFCGKTEELIRLLTRYLIAGKKVLVFTPKKDNRYGNGVICSHNKKAVHAIEITSFDDILPHIANSYKKVDAIFIDEVQFVKNITTKSIRAITEKQNISMYSSGLTLDSFREPFKEILPLLPYAEIEQLTAVCDFCGGFSAKYTYRTSETSDSQVFVGGKEEYCAICADCLQKKQDTHA